MTNSLVDSTEPKEIPVLGDLARASIVRDHGSKSKALILAGTWSDNFIGYGSDFTVEADGISFVYRPDGVLIDVFVKLGRRWGFAPLRKNLADHERPLQPLALHFGRVEPEDFVRCIRNLEKRSYASMASKISQAYMVSDDTGYVGSVCEIKLSAKEVGNKPPVQWLAVNTSGAVWPSYGLSREEASRWLVSSEGVKRTLECGAKKVA